MLVLLVIRLMAASGCDHFQPSRNFRYNALRPVHTAGLPMACMVCPTGQFLADQIIHPFTSTSIVFTSRFSQPFTFCSMVSAHLSVLSFLSFLS